MTIRTALLAIILLLAGCSQDRGGGDRSPSLYGRDRPMPGGMADLLTRSRAVSKFADLPDRGQLVAYPEAGNARRDGAYTWYRTQLSEAYALRAISDGKLRITTPSGQTLTFDYLRHVEHPSGDWTWIGRLEGGEPSDEIIVTFGERAAFGSIAQPGKEPLRLTVRNGISWLVQTDPTAISALDNAATRPRGPDYLIPPKISRYGMTASGAQAAQSPVTAAATASAAATVVDVVLGYSNGFATALGGQSQALTRLNYLVDVTNQAYVNSQVNARVRLVHAMQVQYADNTTNDTALEQLTGFRAPSTQITPSSAFTALRNAREQYGADLVSLVRKFYDPEQDGCGIAWLIGGGQSGIDSSDEFFGYSVVSDGTDVGSDGKSYFCRDETLAHELGHNMGSQHDRATATVDGALKYGIFSYSFGYKTTSTAGNFYTVMAYGDTGQTRYRTFSNPRTTYCGGLTCGIENSADNARSLGQAIPLVARFRATVVPVDTRLIRLFSVAKMATPKTALRILNGQTNFTLAPESISTALPPSGRDYAWEFDLGDYNRDGTLDLYIIAKNGASGTTEVHVLDGARAYGAYLRNSTTLLARTGNEGRWVFKMGDFNRDGTPDLYAIDRMGASGKTDVHVLNGATNYKSFLTNSASALGFTGKGDSWKFELADFNRDGFLDLYTILKTGGSGRTEVHVLSGANNFKSFLLNKATILPQTGSDNTWDFEVQDFNNDGAPDLYAINKRGVSGKTEISILSGASSFQSYLLNVASGLSATGSDNSWDFVIAQSN